MKALNYISWKTRNRHLDVEFFSIYLNHEYKGWGFDLLKVTKNLNSYSLLGFRCMLPNGADKKQFKWYGDILFLRTLLVVKFLDIIDSSTWGHKKSFIERIWYRVLQLLFKY